MDQARRRALAAEALAGYVNGPDAATLPTELGLREAETARALVLVEGVSDQMAVETLAARYGRDLGAEGVVVLPVGGAHAVARFVERYGPHGSGLHLVGLCDAAEEGAVRRGVTRGGLGAPTTRAELAALGFHVCVDDLEDELIRAVGTDRVEDLLASQGDLGSFRTLQDQPPWRGRPVTAQLRRFLGAGSRRKLRYARLLVETLEPSRTPAPLVALLADV